MLLSRCFCTCLLAVQFYPVVLHSPVLDNQAVTEHHSIPSKAPWASLPITGSGSSFPCIEFNNPLAQNTTRKPVSNAASQMGACLRISNVLMELITHHNTCRKSAW